MHHSWGREREKEHTSACTCGRERERALWLLFLYVFFLPPGPALCNWALSAVLFYLKSSLRSWDPPLTFLCCIFTGFSLPCLLATAILDSFSLFWLPNIHKISFEIIFHCRLLKDVDCSSLCYPVNPCCLSIFFNWKSSILFISQTFVSGIKNVINVLVRETFINFLKYI